MLCAAVSAHGKTHQRWKLTSLRLRRDSGRSVSFRFRHCRGKWRNHYRPRHRTKPDVAALLWSRDARRSQPIPDIARIAHEHGVLFHPTQRSQPARSPLAPTSLESISCRWQVTSSTDQKESGPSSCASRSDWNRSSTAQDTNWDAALELKISCLALAWEPRAQYPSRG